MIPKAKVPYIKNAIYLSYTSLNDFLRCPRSFYLKNVYRDPTTSFKLQITSPFLTLGSTVHDAIKWFLEAPNPKPPLEALLAKYRNFWLKYRLKRGGFLTEEEEATFGKRGIQMLENFYINYHKLAALVAPIEFPKYPLAEDVILMGNTDYIGMLPDGSLQVVDFKTGAHDEESRLQLYIYAILAESNYQKPVSSVNFWYLDRESDLREVVLDPLEDTLKFLKDKALEIKDAIVEGNWVCVKGEGLCKDCRDYLAVIGGRGEFMFSDHRYKKEVYFLLASRNSKKTGDITPAES